MNIIAYYFAGVDPAKTLNDACAINAGGANKSPKRITDLLLTKTFNDPFAATSECTSVPHVCGVKVSPTTWTGSLLQITFGDAVTPTEGAQHP